MLLLRSVAFNVFLYGFTAVCSIIAMMLALLAPSQLPGFARWWSRTWLAAEQAAGHFSRGDPVGGGATVGL